MCMSPKGNQCFSFDEFIIANYHLLSKVECSVLSLNAGGSYRNWKKFYFELTENSLSYYKKEGDQVPKRRIDLSTGRGVRTSEQCNLEWPKSAKASLSFGLATDERTFYIYGDNEATVK